MNKFCFYSVLGLCLVLAICSKAQSTSSVWIQGYEQNVYNQYYEFAKDKIHDEFTRKQFATCCLEKTKVLLPKGLESVSDTELSKISNQLINSCATEIKNHLIFKRWTPDIEVYLKTLFINSSDSTLDITYRTQMSNCMLGKLKIIYPDGLNGTIPDDVIEDLSGLCAKELMKIVSWTPELEVSLKDGFAQQQLIKQLRPVVREAICNCYISKMKTMYPKGLPGGKLSLIDAKKVLQQCPLEKIKKSLN